MNPRDVQKAMKRMGIKQEEIEAQMVIIKTKDKDLIINNPQIVKMNMMGQESLQVTGDIVEVERSSSPSINEEDIVTVMEQANCTEEDAKDALEKSSGNIAEAIMGLQK